MSEFVPRPIGGRHHRTVDLQHPVVAALLETAQNGLAIARAGQVHASVRKYMKARGYSVHGVRQDGCWFCWATLDERHKSAAE